MRKRDSFEVAVMDVAKSAKQQLKMGSGSRKGKSPKECCCMCGDVGFEQKLFRCVKCNYRLQHIYCSRLYRKMEDKLETCEWCLETEGKKLLQYSNTKKKPQGRHESGYEAENLEELQVKKCTSNVSVQSNSTNSSAKGLGRRYRLLSEVLC